MGGTRACQPTMTQNPDPTRSQRLLRLRQALAEHLDDPSAAIETLLDELEDGALRTSDWDGLHVAAERDDKEVELGTAYQRSLTRPRLKRLDPTQQVRVLMHAADFFQGILGDTELARTFLRRVLEVDPDNEEAFDRLERAYRALGDARELIHLYALVAQNPPLPSDQLGTRVAQLIGTLPSWMALSEEVCNRLLALVPASPQLFAALRDNCQATGRHHLAQSLRERAFYFQYADRIGKAQSTPLRRPTPTFSKVHIHGFAPSTYTRTARIVCIEKGVWHELVPLDFRSENHVRLHPFLKMPALTHGNVRLYETLAICSYVNRAFPGPALMPEDPIEHARALQWISVGIDYLYRDFVQALRSEAVPSEASDRIGESLGLLETELEGHRYLAGPTLSLADFFIAPMLDLAIERGAAVPGSATRRWLAELKERPSFRKTAG